MSARPVGERQGRFYLMPLLILLYLIFYQNLPDNVNGLAFKPFVTAGTIDRIVKIGAIALSCYVIAVRWSLARQLMRNLNPGLVAVMVLIPLSVLWSINSAATLLRFTTLVGIVLLCLAIPLAGWERTRFQRLAAPPVMFILIASLLVGIFFPGAVIEKGDDISLANSWHGITFQKNQFGMTASVATVLYLHQWLAPGARRSIWTVVGVVVGLVCLVLSRSSTSLLATVLAGTFMVLVMRVPVVKQRFSSLVVVAIFSVIMIYALAVQNLIPGVFTLLSPVMNLTGKDMTFSARSIIWETVKEHARAAPWLGTGYGAYWTGPTPDSPSFVFTYLMYFYPTESHNGYLEIFNDLGRVGLLCLFAFLVYFVRQALQLMAFDRAQAALYLALLYQQMVANLSESEWFSRTTICTILILGSICLSRALLAQRLGATPPLASGRSR